MNERLGTDVIELLKQAGEHFLPPETYGILLFQISGTETARRYEPSETYWERVQMILDTFFSAAERAEICTRLVEYADLRGRPECRGFLAQALAERRLQDLLAAPMLPARPGLEEEAMRPHL